MTGEDQLTRIPAKTEGKRPAKQWLKRIGIAGFLFFLTKGIMWLILLGLVIFGIIDMDAVKQLMDWFSFE